MQHFFLQKRMNKLHKNISVAVVMINFVSALYSRYGKKFILLRRSLQINLIQDDDGIAELNPDEYFNNILRTLRDAIDGDI